VGAPAPGRQDSRTLVADERAKGETEIVSRCELRPIVSVLPRTEFQAKRVKDLRQG